MNDYEIIQQNSALMGFFMNARMNQPPRDRIHYLDTAIEATVNPNTRGKLVQKLYADTLKKANFDFGKIGASKGNLTKYVHYDKLMNTYDCLLALSDGKPGQSLVAYKKLHDILIEARADFEMGYKFNIEFIELTYKTLVLSLHQLLDNSICETVDILRETVQIDMGTKGKNAISDNGQIVLTNVNAFIAAYNNGEWQKMIGAFKTNKNALIGEVLSFATLPLLTIGAIAAVLIAIRGLIYFFYNTRTRLRDYAASEAEILRLQMEMDRDQSPGVEKRKKLLSQLERVADVNANRTYQGEVAAKKDLANADKTLYSANSLGEAGDFELL